MSETGFDKSEETAREIYESVANDLGLNFTDDYSGRAMFGETCWGLSGDAADADIGFAFMEAAIRWGLSPDEYDDVRWVKRFLPRRTDSMGRGTIWYAPHVPYCFKKAESNG